MEKIFETVAKVTNVVPTEGHYVVVYPTALYVFESNPDGPDFEISEASFGVSEWNKTETFRAIAHVSQYINLELISRIVISK